MAITRKTGSELPAFRSVFSDFFENADRLLNPELMTPWLRSNVPATNIKEVEKEFLIEVAAPGLKRKDFHITVEENMLIISVEKEEEEEEKGEYYARKEYSYNNFRRSFSLPESINPDDIHAKYEDGVLRIRLPKRKEAISKPKKEISIE